MARQLCVLVLALFSKLAFAADLPAPLVVVSGGWDSCADDGNGGVSPFYGNSTQAGVRMINELDAYYKGSNWAGMSDHGIRWLFSCFSKTSDLYLQGNQDEGVVATGAWDLNAMVSRIETLSENYRRPIFIIGHSHGGWLAMQLAEALRQPIVDGYLATLDPISFVQCNVSTFADAILGLNWDAAAPCRQAPGDFTAADIGKIRENLGGRKWRHYYQTNFIPLHSGDMAGPDLSLDMTPFFSVINGGAAASISAHTRLAYLDSIWYALTVSLKNVYAPQ